MTSRERYDRSEKGRARHRRYNNSEKGVKRSEEWYWNLTGFQYNFRLLKQRRQKALQRMEDRANRPRETFAEIFQEAAPWR